jgi:GTP cyclohydrolase II
LKDHFFKLSKVIKSKDNWKVYYIIYKTEDSLESLAKEKKPILLRLDSGCVSGQIYDDQECDCLDQLHIALSELSENKKNKGIIIHIPTQDGRGFGTAPKAETEIYKRGGRGKVNSTLPLNTVDAAKLLYDTDNYDFRTFDGAAEILASLNIKSVFLMTDNKEKVESLKRSGINVTRKKTNTNKSSCITHIEAKKNSSLYFNE